MKFSLCRFPAIFFVLLTLFSQNVYADIEKVYFDVFTTKYTSGLELNVWVDVKDSNLAHAPDFVSKIQIIAPGGTTLNLNTKRNWLPFDRGYWGSFKDSDFSGGSIPNGTYRAVVTDIVGKKITVLDKNIKRSSLPIPKITYPSEGATLGSDSPTIRWDRVSGAQVYRVLLFNETWNEPVFWFYNQTAFTNNNRFALPAGSLKPNCTYRLRIEARDGIQDTERRSRSGWMNFETNSL